MLSLVKKKKKKKKKKKVKQIEKVTTSKKLAGKNQQPWKPKIEKINPAIANEGNFVQIHYS